MGTNKAPFFLLESSVNRNGGEVALHQDFVEVDGSGYGFYKYNYLVKQQGVQQIIQLPAFFVFRNVDEILLQTMQSQLGFIIDEDFHLLREN